MAKILIVDDDVVNSQIYTNKLQAEGHEAVLANDGKIAMEKIGEKFDLILLDIMIPKIGGLEILKAIKKGVNKFSTVLIFTNLLSEEIKKDCLENGAKELLLKVDYSPSLLLEKINSYLK
jgi:two-component system response regulator ArlR